MYIIFFFDNRWAERCSKRECKKSVTLGIQLNLQIHVDRIKWLANINKQQEMDRKQYFIVKQYSVFERNTFRLIRVVFYANKYSVQISIVKRTIELHTNKCVYIYVEI